MKKILSIFFCLILFTPILVSAQEPLGNLGSATGKAGEVATKAGVEKTKSPEVYATGIISGALAVLGIVFLILMVYGGFLWMTAKGDEGQAAKAKDTITMAVIGLMIVIASYAATQFIVKYIVGA